MEEEIVEEKKEKRDIEISMIEEEIIVEKMKKEIEMAKREDSVEKRKKEV